jgi:hypothetical protein
VSHFEILDSHLLGSIPPTVDLDASILPLVLEFCRALIRRHYSFDSEQKPTPRLDHFLFADDFRLQLT